MPRLARLETNSLESLQLMLRPFNHRLVFRHVKLRDVSSFAVSRVGQVKGDDGFRVFRTLSHLEVREFEGCVRKSKAKGNRGVVLVLLVASITDKDSLPVLDFLVALLRIIVSKGRVIFGIALEGCGQVS